MVSIDFVSDSQQMKLYDYVEQFIDIETPITLVVLYLVNIAVVEETPGFGC